MLMLGLCLASTSAIVSKRMGPGKVSMRDVTRQSKLSLPFSSIIEGPSPTTISGLANLQTMNRRRTMCINDNCIIGTSGPTQV